MVKELAGIAGVVGASAAALAFSFVAVGFLGFRLIADKKGKEHIARDSRQLIGKWSGRLIGGGLILGLAQFGLQAVMGFLG